VRLQEQNARNLFRARFPPWHAIFRVVWCPEGRSEDGAAPGTTLSPEAEVIAEARPA